MVNYLGFIQTLVFIKAQPSQNKSSRKNKEDISESASVLEEA